QPVIRALAVAIAVFKALGWPARGELLGLDAGPFAVVRVQQPARGLTDQVLLAPAQRRRPGWIDADEAATKIRHRQQILADHPDALALLRLICDPLRQRFGAGTHLLVDTFALGDLLRHDVDTDDTAVAGFQRMPIGQPDAVGIDGVRLLASHFVTGHW